MKNYRFLKMLQGDIFGGYQVNNFKDYRSALNNIPLIFCKYNQKEIWNKVAKKLGTGIYIHLS